MAWISLLTRLIVGHAPIIVGAARAYYAAPARARDAAGPGARAPGSIESLQHAVEQLEAREAHQAALLADLSRQLHDMSAALEALRVRLWLALIGAALAIGVAVVTALLAPR